MHPLNCNCEKCKQEKPTPSVECKCDCHKLGFEKLCSRCKSKPMQKKPNLGKATDKTTEVKFFTPVPFANIPGQKNTDLVIVSLEQLVEAQKKSAQALDAYRGKLRKKIEKMQKHYFVQAGTSQEDARYNSGYKRALGDALLEIERET